MCLSGFIPSLLFFSLMVLVDHPYSKDPISTRLGSPGLRKPGRDPGGWICWLGVGVPASPAWADAPHPGGLCTQGPCGPGIVGRDAPPLWVHF